MTGGDDPRDEDDTREDVRSFDIDIPEARDDGDDGGQGENVDLSSWESIADDGATDDEKSTGDDRSTGSEPTAGDQETGSDDRAGTDDPTTGDRAVAEEGRTPSGDDAGQSEPTPDPQEDRSTGRTQGDRPPDATGSDHGSEPPRPERSAADAEPGVSIEDDGVLRYLWQTDHAVVATVREVVTSVALVAFIGLVLFAASGVWPPLVAIESGSMEPHMSKGDLVFVVEDGRFAPSEAESGIVTYRTGKETGYWSFGNYGNVIVYQPDGQDGTPIIHRAQFYVEEGEDWVGQADPQHLAGVTDCDQVQSCPADHDGFITKGDNNVAYDQVAGRSDVVRPEWVTGVGKVRVPWLGCIRLELSGVSCF